MVSFNEITDLRIPFLSVEFDNTRAIQGNPIQPWEILILGQKLSTGTQAELDPLSVTSKAQARTAFGAGSMLYWMVEKFLQNDNNTPIKVIAIDDVGAGVAATGKVTIAAGAATADGTMQFYVHGERVSVSVSDGDDQDEVTAALVAAINANTDLMVTAAVNGSNDNECDITAKHKGLSGNEIDLRFNYFPDDVDVPGIVPTITAMASGATNPDAQEIVDILPEEQYNIWVNPWTDAANLLVLETELLDRWGPSKPFDGFLISYKMDTFSNLETLGNSRNRQIASISGPARSAPNAPWEWAAAKAGAVSVAAQNDPARPFQTLELNGIKAPRSDELFINSERDQLLRDGIATDKVIAGVVVIERLVTNWQLNAAGQPDTSYLDANSIFILSRLRYDVRARFASKYPRHKLAKDGIRVGPGNAVITPSTAKAEFINLFRDWEFAGLVENADQFIADLIVEINSDNPNRLDSRISPDLVNQFRNLAAQIQFLL